MRRVRTTNAAVLLVAGLSACEPIVFRYPGNASHPPPPSEETFGTLVPTDDPVAVVASPEIRRVVCDDPGERDRLGAFDLVTTDHDAEDPENWLWSSGILAGDLDGDGFLELVTPSEVGASLYRGRDHEAPTERDDLDGFDLSMGIGGSVADYDADGDLDLLVLRYDRPVSLLRNDAPGVFTDVTMQAGVDVVGPSMSSAWADYDADGDLDLFVAGYGYVYSDVASPAPSSLLRNRGDGTFEDQSDLLADQVHDGYTMSAAWQDLDADGWLDLYLVNDIGHVVPNVALRNVRTEAGEHRFEPLAVGLDLATSGTGLASADLNGDRVPDFLIPQWGKLSLMLSHGADHGAPRWIDHANALGLQADGSRDQAVGWGAELADLDNDGDLDAVVAFGHAAIDGPGWENPLEQPDGLYLQQDDGTFVDVAEQPWWDIADLGAQRGVVVADFNGDGWLDVAKRTLDGPEPLYLARCGSEAWMEVRLTSDAGNRFAVGSRVEVTLADATVLTRWVRAGGTGFGSGGTPWVHFGLGSHDSVRRVTVHWPDGRVSTFDDLETRTVVTLARIDSVCDRPDCW